MDMKHDWIISVLADVGRYARQHGLDDLADHLHDGLKVAAGVQPYGLEGRGTDVIVADILRGCATDCTDGPCHTCLR